MEDLKIIELYHARNEVAISETSVKYGAMLNSIAFHILSNRQDSEETVNDTYHKAWISIPPHCPNCLCAYLGRITRNLSINRWHQSRAQKRYNGAEILLSELSDCIPAAAAIEKECEAKELTLAINTWLSTLSRDDRVLFLRRYWFGESVKELAFECGTTPNKLSGRLFRLRQSLKQALEREGIAI